MFVSVGGKTTGYCSEGLYRTTKNTLELLSVCSDQQWQKMAMGMAMGKSFQKIRRPLSEIPSQILSTISSITSLLQNLNPQHPNSPLNPNPAILNQFSPHLNHHFVIKVLENQKNPYHALFFFNWASNPNPNPNNYTHNHFCYIAITDVLISRNLFPLATELLESHNRLSDFMVGKLIKAHGDLGHVRRALDLFDLVRGRYTGRCLFSYNSILGVLVRGNQVDLAERFFDQMVSEGVVTPDVSTCTVMVRGFCKAGMIEKAKKVFDEMPCSPNLLTYNTMISGLCKKGLMKAALEIVDKMMERKDCLPDTVTYTTLIDGFCKKGETEAAKKCFDVMVSRNCELNEVTFNALINGLCLCGDVDGAKKMMTSMRLNGVKDTITTHTSLLKGYCIAGRSDEAFKHFRDMVSLGMKPDMKCYEVVVSEYCKMCKPHEAISLLREMNGIGIRPRVFSFNAVLRVLGELGQPNRAVLILKHMPQMGCSPNFLSYNAVICGLVRAKGRMKVVEGLVKDMVRDGFNLDATLYTCLVEGYWEDGNEEVAIQVCLEMIANGFVMNIERFSRFVDRLGSSGKVFEAEKIFERMSRCSRSIDVGSYRKVLDDMLFLVNGRDNLEPRVV